MSRRVHDNTGKGKWTEINQHGSRLDRELLRTDPLKKGIDRGHQGGLTPSCFPLTHTQKRVVVGHIIIDNLLGDVSVLYGLFFR